MTVAAGFRIKTGKAIVIAVETTDAAPKIIDRREIALSDPNVEESFQPYHAGLDAGGEEAPVVIRACTAVMAASGTSFQQWLDELPTAPVRIGIVVNNLNDPTRIGNDHIRAHALEGKLFYEALEAAAGNASIESLVVIERDAWADAAASIGTSEKALRETVAATGKSLGPPWRADEKSAYLAAWIALCAA